jgi:hypothetical protein
LGVCAISYDSQFILQDFARRGRITYPLLSDWNSAVIRKFGILNTTIQPEEPGYGVPFPGTYLVDEKGIIVAKYFEEDFRDRITSGTILTRAFRSPLNTRQTVLQLDHLSLSYYASEDACYPGQRISLIAQIQTAPGVHLYAPGRHRYHPVRWELKQSLGFTPRPITYPEPSMVHLPAIDETVPVYTGDFRLVQDVIVTPNSNALPRALNADRELVIEGNFYYQACDDKTCYLPKAIPIRWVIQILNLDEERVPEMIRNRP